MSKLLKGSEFSNRYRITGQLTTLSPLHIGTGEESETRIASAKAKASEKSNEPSLNEGKSPKDKTPSVSTIIKDDAGKPLIPGSTLRGVMRHWLLSVLLGIPTNWAATRDYTDDKLLTLSQPEQTNKVITEFSLLELLFGTPFNAGKVEIWDATCTTPSLSVDDSLLHWDPKSLTYIDTSVAIDPDTGTALERLLYQTEVVPPGVAFEFNLVAQNLSDVELGLILLALQGFNSAIYPIRVGARSGRGYGRIQYGATEIYYLDQADLPDWINSTINDLEGINKLSDQTALTGNAGFFALPKLTPERQQTLVADVKTKLRAELGKE